VSNRKQPLARKAFLAQERKPKLARCEHCGFPDDARPVWVFGLLDLDGPWGWSGISADQLGRIRARFVNFETMTWTAVQQGTGSHPVEISKLSGPAVARLAEIKQEDVDSLYSLRITGRMRVWGIKDGATLRILWFDPNHEVCPSLPA
jgi:hypothetical protein